MQNIKNTDYITINKDGMFIEGKPTTHYLGEKMLFQPDALDLFKQIQQLNNGIQELQVLSSETMGERAEIGNPSEIKGKYSWCRIKLTDGTVGKWVCCDKYRTLKSCSRKSVYFCALNVLHDKKLQYSLFRTTLSKPKIEDIAAQKIRNVDFSKISNMKTIQINGFDIVILKQKRVQE